MLEHAGGTLLLILLVAVPLLGGLYWSRRRDRRR